jgi:nitrilase
VEPVKAAVVQAGAVAFDPGASVEKARGWMAEAAAGGARLAVFPEAIIGGYPKGADFGARVGMRSPEGRREFRRYFEGAIEVPGPHTETLGEAARTHGLHVVIGVVERAGGTLYCTALFFGPSGELLGRHRKVMPTAMERLIWGFGDGSTLPVLETPLGRIGAAICWENYMPLLRAGLYGKGIQLYCAPTVDDRETWVPTMRHIALEGRCFVLSACQFVPQLIRGGSMIVNPLGQILAGPQYGEEAIITATLDPGEIAEGKFDLDVAGHYARPDIFRLSVNERPLPAVDYSGNSSNEASVNVNQRDSRNS